MIDRVNNTPVLSRTCIPRESLADKFKRRERLLPSHRRKRLQEIVERISDFKIVEEVLHRNASAYKDGHAALDVRIAMNNELLHSMSVSIRGFFAAFATRTRQAARASAIRWAFACSRAATATSRETSGPADPEHRKAGLVRAEE